MGCGCGFAPRSRTVRALSLSMRMKSWNSNWSAASPTAAMRRRSHWSALRTSRGCRRPFSALTDGAINVDMIVQNVSADGRSTDMTFTVAKADMKRAVSIIAGNKSALDYAALKFDDDIVKISVSARACAATGRRLDHVSDLGRQGHQHSGHFDLGNQGFGLIAEEYAELAIRALHGVYLDAED